jgi:hypothetical protein
MIALSSIALLDNRTKEAALRREEATAVDAGAYGNINGSSGLVFTVPEAVALSLLRYKARKKNGFYGKEEKPATRRARFRGDLRTAGTSSSAIYSEANALFANIGGASL